MNDLLYYIKGTNILSATFHNSIESLKSIRNWVAHNKDLTPKLNFDSNPLYKIKELKQFVKNANRFFDCYEELEEEIQLLKKIDIKNATLTI